MDNEGTVCSDCGSFSVTLDIEPPTVTHHAKKLAVRRYKNGLYAPMMYDSKELQRVRDNYAILLAASGKRPRKPLEGPISLHIRFVFQGNSRAWHVQKPDRDNLNKTLQDALVDAGFIAADQTICAGNILKVALPMPRIEIRGSMLFDLPDEDCPWA